MKVAGHARPRRQFRFFQFWSGAVILGHVARGWKWAALHADVAQVRILLGSPDARVRALAARSACPCHGTFELLHALKDELTLLAETDPDKNVRSAAGHTLREAIELNAAEEAKLSRERDREVRQERRDRKRAVRSDVALRRARRRA